MIYSIKKQNKYKIMTRKEFGVNCMDIENEDMEWRQFLDGIYYYVRYYYKVKTNNTFTGKLKNKYLRNKTVFRSFAYSFLWNRPYFLKGVLFAKKNKHHDIIKLAFKYNVDEWMHLGSTPLKLVSDFKVKGKKGTGYSHI
jgi:hypothetical protein